MLPQRMLLFSPGAHLCMALIEVDAGIKSARAGQAHPADGVLVR